MVRLIGDVHGKYGRYKSLIAGCQESIQIGDMGVGFRHTQGPNEGHIYGNPPFYAMVRGRHRFIRGNHDNPTECRRHPMWLEDSFIEGDIMFIGGAFSIDHQYRRKDYSWWVDEQLSIEEFNVAIDKYLAHKPRVMITHDCPEEIAIGLSHHNGIPYDFVASRTRQAFQQMWQSHPPELWVFGHWHHSFDYKSEKTRFVCLAELEARDDLL